MASAVGTIRSDHTEDPLVRKVCEEISRLPLFSGRKHQLLRSALGCSLTKCEDVFCVFRRQHFARFALTSIARQMHVPIKKNVQVVVIGDVFRDGLGDLTNIAQTAVYIKRYLSSPLAKVRAIADVQNLDERFVAVEKALSGLPGIEVIITDRFLTSRDKTTIRGDYEAVYDPKIVPALRSADIVYEMPLTPECIIRAGAQVSYTRKIEEYGTFPSTSKMFRIQGVGTSGLGMYIMSPMELEPSVTALDSAKLKHLLLQEEEPRYHATHRLLFGYIKSCHLFFVASLCFALASSEKNLDIICDCDLTSFDRLLPLLKKSGITEMQFYRIKEDEIETINFILQEDSPRKKVLRIINPFPLSNRDVHRLMAFSSSLAIGCTGVMSFSESLAYGLPFYIVPTHKKRFFIELRDYAKEVLGESSSLNSYFDMLLLAYSTKDKLSLAEECGKLLADSLVKEEMKRFVAILRENYSYEDSVQDMVHHDLVLKQNPFLASHFENLVNEYGKEAMSLLNITEQWRHALEELN